MSEQTNQSESTISPLHAEVEDRFGVLPNFFRLAPEAPEITANLWGFAKFGYLDNPLPPLFKERLFVYLSRFCEVRYCIARHVGFLAGLGRPAGDRQCTPETVEQVVRLIRRTLPRGDDLEPFIEHLEECASPLGTLPDSDTTVEEALFACATHVFLQTPQATRCLEALRRVFDGAMFQHLLVFLTFVRTAHFWTKLHPELKFEDDITELLSINEALAECALNDPEAMTCEATQGLLNELTVLRRERALRQEVERANAALREREEELRDAQRVAHVGSWRWEARTDVTFGSDQLFRIYGLDPITQALPNFKCQDGTLYPHESWQQINLAVQETMRTGIGYELDVQAFRNGEPIWITTRSEVVKNSTGEIVGLRGTVQDVTERKRAEESLRAHERQLQFVSDNAPVLIAQCDTEGRYKFVNKPYAARFGLQPKDVIGRRIPEVVGEKAFDTFRQYVVETLAGKAVQFEAEIPYRTGVSQVMRCAYTPELDACGNVVGLVAAIIDITDRKQAEAAVRESEARYRAIGEAIDHGVWMCDAEGRNTYASESFLRLVGITQEQCSGDGWGHVLHPDDAEATIAAWMECVRTGGVWDREHRFKGVDGQWHYVLARGIPVRNDQGRVIGWAGINLDIDRIKNSEAALREADRRKDEFLATLAHELRNPLAPIRNGLQIMRLANDDQEAVEQTRTMMERQLGQLVHLVDDLLDLSRISRGKIELRKERVELAKIVQHAVETSRPAIDSAGHDLSITVPSVPIYVDADMTRLAQVFSNLLNNAAKYTERGGRVRLSVVRQGGEAVVSVRDNGLGIPAHMLPNVFDMFTQVDRNLERSQGGLGIGLSIVKRLVEMHGGSVDVKSDGHSMGSEFIVHLPVVLSVVHSQNDHGEPTQPSSRCRILVADDNRDAAMSLAMMLNLMGNDAKTAHDGLEALDVAAAFRPELILLDIGMPRLNGYDTARQIREQPWGKSIVLVALTGWGQEEDRRKSQDAGFDFHMVKPIEPAALEKLLTGLKADTA